MIRDFEIREKARIFEVPESTIEKDYALGWILRSLYRQTDVLVLKGGTGIRKAYIEDFRFSEDLDFTVLEPYSMEKLESIIRNVISNASKESGINFSDRFRSKENINGYQIDVYFRLLRQSGTSPLRIKLDITKYGAESLLLPPVKRKLLHLYSDKCSGTLLVYSMNEIVAEKFRSLFQRTRPRDLYDSWYIPQKFDINDAVEIFPKKCRIKDVRPNIESLIERKENFAGAWKSSLGHQLKDLPDFELVFGEVVEFLKTYVNSLNNAG